jgi:hypothetical protein
MTPSFDSKSALRCTLRLVIVGGVASEFERAQIEAKRLLAPLLKPEIDDRAVCRHGQRVVLTSKIGLG